MANAKNFLWNGAGYETWQDLIDKSQGNLVDFTERIWLNRIFGQLKDYRESFRTRGVAAMPPRPCDLPIVSAIIGAESILDFGGSSGWSWEFLKNSSPKNKVKSYVVVENATVTKFFHDACLHEDPRISCVSKEMNLDECDLCYCNSVLQYMESNREFISIVTRTKPKFVYLEDLVANEKLGDYFSLQNYHGKYIPYRFIGLNSLIEEMSDAGYSCVSMSPYLSPINGIMSKLPMDNFPEEQRIDYTLSVMFRSKH